MSGTGGGRKMPMRSMEVEQRYGRIRAGCAGEEKGEDVGRRNVGRLKQI